MNYSLPVRNLYAKDKTILARIISFKNLDDTLSTEFFSDKEEILQCGFIKYKNKLKPDFHFHNPVKRSTIGTSEALYILKGSGNLEVRESEKDTTQIEVINEGDLINLISGLHRIVPHASDLLMIEIKNGPYISQDIDKQFIKA